MSINKLKCLALYGLLINALTNTHAASLSSCEQIFQQKDYSSYMDKCSENAANSLTVKWNLAQIYQYGWGNIQPNPQRASYYAEPVAISGVKEAQALLCKNYSSGAGVALDPDKAFWYCSRASSQGDTNSSLYLAYQYKNGIGTSKDISKSISIYQNLAENGNGEAQFELSKLLLEKESDSPQGFFWLRQSYKQNFSKAKTYVDLSINNTSGCNYLAKYFDSNISFYDAVAECSGQQKQAQDSSGSLISQSTPHLIFSNQAQGNKWLQDMSNRLKKIDPTSYLAKSESERKKLLTVIQYESARAGLDPQLVLSMITVLSKFNQYKISNNGNIGLMQVDKYLVKKIGDSSGDLLNIQTNLRYGCTILRYYMQLEHGDTFYALGRYNGSRGKPDFPKEVYNSYNKFWTLTNSLKK